MSADVCGMILAAGYGTRLGALSDERPKPLLPVCDQPLVTWALRHLEHHGIERVAVNLHHLGEGIREALGATGGQAALQYSVERGQILGTGGGVKKMAALMPEAEIFVVLNGKIVCDLDLREAVAFHQRQGSLATMVLHPRENARAWGAIGVDAEHSLTRLVDIARAGRGDGGEHMFTGIHVLSRGLIDAIPEGPCCILRSAYRALFEKGAPLSGYVHRGYFYEHSTPERYLQGNFNLLRGDVEPLWAPGPLRGVHETAQIAEDVEVDDLALIGAGAVIEAGARIGGLSVVGAGARVAAESHVRRSVIWPGAEAAGDVELSVVTEKTTLRLEELGDPTAAPR